MIDELIARAMRHSSWNICFSHVMPIGLLRCREKISWNMAPLHGRSDIRNAIRTRTMR